MAWTMKLDLLETRSCGAPFPCVLGPAKPAQEWCSAGFGREIGFGARAAPGVSVDGIGQVVFQLINVEGGAPVTISGAPILNAFGIKSENLAFAHGTRFSDPDLRSWESLGAGGVVSEVVVWTG